MCSSYFQYKGIILYGDHNPVTTELLISEHALQKKKTSRVIKRQKVTQLVGQLLRVER